MRDISELDAAMEAFDVPLDVRQYIARARVSQTLYYLWSGVFLVLGLAGMGLGFWAVTQFLLPFEDMNTCFESNRLAPALALLSAMIAGIPLTAIATTYLTLALPKTHWISFFAVGFLNENNDPFSSFFVRRMNRDRPIGDPPDKYIIKASKIWLPYAWLGFAIGLILTLLGVIWTNAVC